MQEKAGVNISRRITRGEDTETQPRRLDLPMPATSNDSAAPTIKTMSNNALHTKTPGPPNKQADTRMLPYQDHRPDLEHATDSAPHMPMEAKNPVQLHTAATNNERSRLLFKNSAIQDDTDIDGSHHTSREKGP